MNQHVSANEPRTFSWFCARSPQGNGLESGGHLTRHLRRVAASLFCLLLIQAVGCQTFPSQHASHRLTVHDVARRSLERAEALAQPALPRTPTSTDPNSHDERPSVQQVAHLVSRTSDKNMTPVTDEFLATDIREAIQSLASQAQAPVVIDDSVTGTVTATIDNEPFDNALDKLLLPLGLYARVDGGKYLVCDSNPESAMFGLIAERLEFQPLHSSPEELVSLIPDKHQQYVRAAKSRNLLIIQAPSTIAQNIFHEIQSFDQPVPQVVLEAMVVVISPDSEFQFGGDIGQSHVSGDQTFNVALDGLAIRGNWSQAAFGQLFGKFAVTSFFLRSLEQEGYLSIRATPHVMAKSGEKAEISIARETFFSTQPVNSQLLFRQDIQKVEAGITLEIMPTIRGDNVLMVIDRAEVSENIRSTINDPNLSDPYPLINRRKVTTTVNVKDGETVVIGGLMQNQLVDRTSRVPVLGDLPVIGKLFHKIEQQQEAAEVVVFISPRIVRNSSEHPYGQVEGHVEAGDECDSTSPQSIPNPAVEQQSQHHHMSPARAASKGHDSRGPQLPQLPQLEPSPAQHVQQSTPPASASRASRSNARRITHYFGHSAPH